MVDLNELIETGEGLLVESRKFAEVNKVICGKVAAEFKSLHIQGRFALRKIDKGTLAEYNSLFSSKVDLSANFNYVSYNNYLRSELEKCIGILMAVDTAGIDEALDKSVTRVFISHGGFSPSFKKLETFIHALGMSPIYDQAVPTSGATVNEHVERMISVSDFYVILMKKDMVDKKNAKEHPKHNVTIEFDRLARRGKDNMLVLLEEGCAVPSMQQDIIHVSFSEECMDVAFTRLCSELLRHDLL